MSFQVANAPYNAMQPGYDNQYSSVQNLPTAANDTQQQPQTPEAPITGNEVSLMHFSQINLHILVRISF